MLRSYLEMGEYTFDMAVVLMGVSFEIFAIGPSYNKSWLEICIIRAQSQYAINYDLWLLGLC